LNDVLDMTLQMMEIESGGIYLLDDATGVLTIVAQRGFTPEFVAEIDRLSLGEGFSGRVAESGQPLVVSNLSADPRLTRKRYGWLGCIRWPAYPSAPRGRFWVPCSL
jgi:signal transduction protein with GAF and PtsI domain